MRTSLGRIATALAALLFTVALRPAMAQDWSKLWKDPEVANYQLTLAHLRTYGDVMRAVASEPETMAALDREFKALQQRKPQPTIADVVSLVEQQPKVRSVFAKARVSARDYLVQTAAIANAALHVTLRKQGAGPSTAAQKANVALIEAHPAEWKQLQETMAQVVAKANPKQ